MAEQTEMAGEDHTVPMQQLAALSGAELKRMAFVCPVCLHLISTYTYFAHVNGCRQKSARPLAKCPYNKRHRMDCGQVETHMKICPNRPFATGDTEVPPAPPGEEEEKKMKMPAGGKMKKRRKAKGRSG